MCPCRRTILPVAIFAASVCAAVSKSGVDSPEVGVPGLYKGMMVWAFMWAFLDAFTIGANDVANAFANAVAAGTVTHRGACLIACFCEPIGAILFGKNVTDFIRKKMVDVKKFDHDPYLLALGMSFVNVASGGWVLVATILGMPVSTTHSVVGATLGLGIAAFGTGGVKWSYPKGFGGVVASWFISPVASATLATIFYMATKIIVLKLATDRERLNRGLQTMPVFFFFVFGTFWGFMLIKGIPALKKADVGMVSIIIVCLAVFHAIYCALVTVPWLRRVIVDKENLPWYTSFFTPCVGVGSYGYMEAGPKDGEAKDMDTANVVAVPAETVAGGNLGQEEAGGSAMDQIGQAIVPGFYMDIGKRRAEDAAMHAQAFTVDSETEEMYKFVQLVSCCFFSVSHGANDVANAVGPFAAVWMVYESGTTAKKAEVPIWLKIYAALALDIGLLTMGHHIMAALGNRMTLISPSRGFCIESGAMFTVMVASKVGLPVSTTHCITGATVGVGLCNGNMGAINWKLFAIVFFGWLITCPCSGLVCGIMFAGAGAGPRAVPTNGMWFMDDPKESPWLKSEWAQEAYGLVPNSTAVWAAHQAQ